MNAIGKVWNDVPSEILLHVFSYLNELDLVHASSVSRKWRQMFFEPRFWRSATFNFNHFFQSPAEITEKLKIHAQAVGSYWHHVTIICPDSKVLVQRQIADWVNVIFRVLVETNRTILTLNINNLRMSKIWDKEIDYAKCDLMSSICHFIESQTCLQTLDLTEALLPTEFGHMVMSSLARSPSVVTLKRLNIFNVYAIDLNWNKRQRELIRSSLQKCTKLEEIGLDYILLKGFGVMKLIEIVHQSLKKLNLRVKLSPYDDDSQDEDDAFSADNDVESDYDDEDDDEEYDDYGVFEDGIAPEKWKKVTRICPGLRVSMEIDTGNGFLFDYVVPAMPVSHLTIKDLSSDDNTYDDDEVSCLDQVLQGLCRSPLENLATVSFIGDTGDNIRYDREIKTNQQTLVNFLVKYPNLRSVQFSANLMSVSLLERVRSDMWARFGLDPDILSII